MAMGQEAVSPPKTTADILRQEEVEMAVKLKALKSADVAAELDAALKRGDRRFLDLTGFGAVPGVENWSPRLEKKYGVMVVGSGGAMIVEDGQKEYEQALSDYASRYNRLLFAKLDEKPDPAEDLNATPLDRRIDVLIERLALSDDPAEGLPLPTPSQGTLPSDRRMIAFDAVKELTKIGYPAFPKLVARLEDRRQSIAISRHERQDLGTACLVILRDQIYSFPEGYRFGYSREGADRQSHVNSYYADREFFGEDIAPWITARKDKSLLEIQIEVLTWVVERERGAGAPTEEERQEYVVSLEKHLEGLKEKKERAAK